MSLAAFATFTALLLSPALALGQSPAPPPAGDPPEQATAPAVVLDSSAEAEEPDFAFLTGGPYTQKKKSLQFIYPTRFDWRRSAGREERNVATLLRVEWGFTDRLELDVIANAAGARLSGPQGLLASNFTRGDTVVGLRYRLLDEASAPVTLTMGPQFLLPTGRKELGTSAGKVGYGWDVAAAKDWRGPVFVYSSLNFRFTPRAPDPTSGSNRRFNLQSLAWASALVWRTVERPRSGGSKHDIHTFFEVAGERADELEAGAPGSVKSTLHAVVFAPGVRYGFMTVRKKLFEVGVSFPVGLNRAAPDFGMILQFQFEQVF